MSERSDDGGGVFRNLRGKEKAWMGSRQEKSKRLPDGIEYRGPGVMILKRTNQLIELICF